MARVSRPRLPLPSPRRPGQRQGLIRDADGLDEEAERRERRREPDQVGRAAREVLGHEAVGTVDAAFERLLGWGHVGLAALELLGRAGRGRAADGRHDDVADLEARVVRVLDDADRLVAQHEVVGPLGEPAVLAGDDLVVGAVHADPERPDEDLPRARVRPVYLDDGGRVRSPP